MDELIKLVSDKTGLSPDNSRLAVETVLGFLKTRLPAPIAAQVDSVMGGGGLGGQLGDAAKGLGGLFDKG